MALTRRMGREPILSTDKDEPNQVAEVLLVSITSESPSLLGALSNGRYRYSVCPGGSESLASNQDSASSEGKAACKPDRPTR